MMHLSFIWDTKTGDREEGRQVGTMEKGVRQLGESTHEARLASMG